LNISNIHQVVSKNGAMAEILYKHVVLFDVNLSGITNLRCWPGLALHPFGARLHKLDAASGKPVVLFRERTTASTRVESKQLSKQIERNA